MRTGNGSAETVAGTPDQDPVRERVSNPGSNRDLVQDPDRNRNPDRDPGHGPAAGPAGDPDDSGAPQPQGQSQGHSHSHSHSQAPATASSPAASTVPAASAATSVEIIQRELTAVSRRARATAARMHPELSLVSYTILAHLEDHPNSRATDLAAHYLLDKSTVSRQVTALERLGYVERRTDPEDHRVQVLHLAPAGVETLAGVNATRRQAFRERLADWAPEDLERFAGYLLRYNAAAAAHP